MDFISHLASATQLPPPAQAEALARLLSVNPQVNSFMVKLNSQNSLSDKQLDEVVDGAALYAGDWPAFNEVAILFIRLSQRLNAYLLLESFDLFSSFLNDLSIAFNNNQRGYLLVPLVKDTVDFVLPLATKLDYHLYYKENCTKPRLTYIAALVLKMFNNIRSQLGAGDHIEAMKKSIILFMGVRLCSIYFKINNPLLCRNIFSNMSNAQLLFDKYPLNQQLHYRYYLARFYLIKNQFVDAYLHLTWCLEVCPTTKDNRNVTRILELLIPTGILLGKIPNLAAFAATFYSTTPHFLEIYARLTRAITSGNLGGFHAALNEPATSAYLRSVSMYVSLSSKGNVLVLRNLLKRVWVLGGKSNKLDFDTARRALGLSLGSSGVFAHAGDDTVENVFVSLIDQNLIRGKLFPRLRCVSLSKTNVFPPVAQINFLKHGYGGEHVLSSSDKWMQ